MTTTLQWQPVSTEWESLPYELKRALQKRDLTGVTLDRSYIPYLQGLADAGVKGADTLIEAIGKHGRISLREYS